MNDAMVIRPASPADVQSLADLGAIVQKLHHAHRPDAFKAANRRDLEAWFQQTLQQANWRIACATCGSVAVGYIVTVDGHRAENAFAPARTWREIEQLAVRPTHRRRGVARALIEHVAQAALADRIGALELTAWAFNDEAQAVFRRLGFVERTRRYERPAVSARRESA